MMNRQLTKKLIGIAASAALMGTVAFSGSAIAGKGPQSSAGVSAWCEVDVASGQLDMYLTIVDKSSGVAVAELDSVDVQGLQKDKGRGWDPIAGAEFTDGTRDDDTDNPTEITFGEDQLIELDICEGLLASSKAINAEAIVTLLGKSSKEEYTAKCGDNPDTLYVNEANIKVADYYGLCQ